MSALNLNDFAYTLPEEKIALYPLANRDHSKLLVYRNGNIEHTIFHRLVDFLPANSFLFFNNTRVIPARLHFTKETGATIEIFLLNPVTPSAVLSETMQATSSCTWQCTIGNVKRWASGIVLRSQLGDVTLEASLIDKDRGLVHFSWAPTQSFASIITLAGETPLPPYLKRKAETSDKERYQTIYSHHEGAVAAPTAGLHFTDAQFQALHHKNIHHDFLTLHVSAGTFQPIKSENANDHVMHREQIVITQQNVHNLLQDDRFIIPVGTTSMRTLESLYWFGVKLLNNEKATFTISQHDPYLHTVTPSRQEALQAVLHTMQKNNTEQLIGDTSIFIKPGYRFKVCSGLITNFHQPASTLILLVAAFTGDHWKKIYAQALENDYRFLSYGDSSLLIP